MQLVMDLSQFFVILSLVAAAAYTTLLSALLLRGSVQSPQGRWFSAVLVTSVLWALSHAMIPPSMQPNVSLWLLTASAAFLGATTAAYVGWTTERRWLLMGSISLLLAPLLDLFWPYPLWLKTQLQAWTPTTGTLLTLSTWAALNFAILRLTWRDYRQMRPPWHANRLLHWAVFALATALGELLTVMPNLWLIAAGQFGRFVAIFFLFRAISSHHLFDVRARLRKGFAFALIAVVSAIPAAIVLTISLRLREIYRLPLFRFYVVAMLVIACGFVLYQPFRRHVAGIVYRYFVGQEFHTSTVVRRYSQAISGTLDMNQLAREIVGIIGDLLQTTRGALLLVSSCDEGYEVELIPGLNHQLRGRKVFAPDSHFIASLLELRLPLLQYDLDFNPLYSTLAPDERQWLEEQGMEVYVPIHHGERLDGLIALGPKSSGLAYRANELDLVHVLAEQTVIALQNARLYSEVNRQNDRIRSLNIDLRQQNERLEILDRIKSDFITIASHELRTPLTQVKGYADILTHLNENGPVAQSEASRIMEHINRASSRLETLITAMLDASELEISGMELSFMEARLEMVTQLAVEPLTNALHERHIQLRQERLAELPPMQVDLQRLVQAFQNVLGNAVKYTPDHGVITVSASLIPSADGKQDFVEVVIADTGIGIDPQYHDLIFEKFFRVGSPELHSTGATKFKGGGPGLGLHIAKGVIEAHGGHIWVKSSGEDETQLPGSRFHIVIPIAPPGRQTTDREQKTAVDGRQSAFSNF